MKHYYSAPYHPATNGAVERMVKTFKQIIKREGKPFWETLENFLFKYRLTVTGSTPAELFLNRPLRTKFDLLKPGCREIVSQNQARQKYHHDRRAQRSCVFEVGQKVLARDYRSGQPNWSRGHISKVLGSQSYTWSH